MSFNIDCMNETQHQSAASGEAGGRSQRKSAGKQVKFKLARFYGK